MPLDPTTLEALTDEGIVFTEDFPLWKRTWWRCGGPADAYASIGTLADLSRVQSIAQKTACPVFVMGNASNLLIGDLGIRGLVIRLSGDLASSRATSEAIPRLHLGAGLNLMVLVSRMRKQGWTGLEMIAGIPGTVGGAIRMNAGTALGEVSDALESVEVVHPDGQVQTLQAEQLNLRYRHAELPPGAIVASALFRTTGEPAGVSADRIEHHLAYRARTQPVDVPTCGSTFRNPDGDTAGRLIDHCGLKGRSQGGAQVSPKHANFIVNTGDATSWDIRCLIEAVQAEVQAQTGTVLRREVHFAGQWSPRPKSIP